MGRDAAMRPRGYYLGCPGWGMRGWTLESYARVFNTVEGNTTFYALPSPDTVARWDAQTPDDFRFCFKFPRVVTHDKLLVDVDAEIATFLGRIEPLAPKLGALYLHLPPRCDATQLGKLARFCAALPRAYRYAIEVRAPVFFRPGPAEDELLAILRERGIDLVLLDTRGIHASKSLVHAAVRDQRPKLPLVVRTTAAHPFVRCVPHEDWAANAAIAEGWATQVAAWIAEGKTPYVFLHAPDDDLAADNAYAFHALVRAHADVGDLAPPPTAPRQLGLF